MLFVKIRKGKQKHLEKRGKIMIIWKVNFENTTIEYAMEYIENCKKSGDEFIVENGEFFRVARR